MFTGIIEEVGTLKDTRADNGSQVLTIGCTRVVSDVQLGDSICVSGVCLTVTAFDAQQFTALASPETLRLTTLGTLRPGDAVNLERSVTLQTRMGGHMVQGHVDGTATVSEIRPEGDCQIWQFRADNTLTDFMIHKGSVTVNGVSLTISQLTDNGFEVALIPKTIELTTFQHMKVGSPVNIETDLIGKYVYKFTTAGEAAGGRPW